MKTTRFKNYLLYALGEIILVVIGITLAVAINNWNEERHNSQQQKLYLESLVADVEKEIVQLNENIQGVDEKLALIKQVKPFLGTKQSNRDTIVRKVFELARLINFYPENTTYQTLINSGDMKLIDDFKLRKKLENHYASHGKTLQAYERIEEIHRKYLGDFFIYKINFGEVFKGNTNFLDDPLMSNIITSVEGAYFLLKSANGNCLKSNNEMLTELQNLLDLEN